MRSKTMSQRPRSVWRNRRAVGYQGPSSELLGPKAFLQVDEPDALDPGQPLELDQPERSIGIPGVLGISLPGDADPEPRPGAEPLSPALDARGIGREVWDRGRDDFQGRREEAHQSQERRVEVELRQRFTARDDLVDPRARLQQPDQGLLALHDHAPDTVFHEGRVADKLHDVS